MLSIFSFAALASLLIGGTLLEWVLPVFEAAMAGGPTASPGEPAMGICEDGGPDTGTCEE